MKISSFKISRSSFCTCLPKYNLNPYLGRCAHRCIYCYAVKFPSFRGPIVPRLKFKEDIDALARNTRVRWPVMLSDSTDPYQPVEKECEITRRCVEVLAKHGFPLLIVTKSDLVVRDIDILKKTRTVVSMTITTPREEVASLIEPNAPSPRHRFAALEKAAKEELPTVVRIDSIIPGVNSNMRDLEEIVSKAAEIGVKQVTASTMKLVRGVFPSIEASYGRLSECVTDAYSDGAWVSGYRYLDIDKRLDILERRRATILKHDLKFATCREGCSHLNTAICDGTSYFRELLRLHGV